MERTTTFDSTMTPATSATTIIPFDDDDITLVPLVAQQLKPSTKDKVATIDSESKLINVDKFIRSQTGKRLFHSKVCNRNLAFAYFYHYTLGAPDRSGWGGGANMAQYLKLYMSSIYQTKKEEW